MANTIRIPTEFTAVDRFTSVVSRMTSGVATFSKSASSAVMRVDNKINKMWGSLDGISQLAFGGGIVSGFAIAGKAVMDYEDALASLQAVTGESSSKFKSQIESIAKSTNKSAIEVAGSFEIVGSAMSQYLSNPKALGDITNAGIILSKAAKMDLEPALQSLTSAMNQFNLGSEQALDTVNRLTAGEIVGSVSTAKATEQLSKFGAVANSVNVTLPESVALIQTLGKKFTGSMQSEIGTAAKNLLLIMDASSTASKDATAAFEKHGVKTKVLMDRTLPLSERLKELSKIQKDGASMALVFGKENAAAGNVIFNQLDTYVEWEKTIRETNKAQEQAKVNSDTLSKAIESIKNAFINSIVSGEKNNNVLDKLKGIAGFVANNMDLILNIIMGLIVAFGLFKAVVLTIAVVTGAYNIALGIMGGLSGVASIAIGQSTIAMNAYKATTAVATAAQWLWNAAMNANPIVLIIVGIAALIALVIIIIAKWDEWGAALSLFLGPVGLIIGAFKSVYDHWESIKTAFKTEGILGGLKRIGQVILDAILKPLQQLFEMIGLDSWSDSLKKLRTDMNLVTQGEMKAALESPESKQAKASAKATVNGEVNVNVSAKNGTNADATTQNKGGIPVKLSPTQGAFGYKAPFQ
ncbi:hypothetical protein [Flavobacterium phage V157]|uniref:Phage tail tape measure protein domain-containing protein n=19 Tax=Ficleduovirus TaxID=2560131 RepID=A0A218M8I1_9CAUD|nr:tail length tape measure protein [Flavobacterium phage FCV-1]ASD51614.1 hypothetical protein [Flavobacterium phage FCV-3]ASD51688.1 hypothetical protein [Flavobacterium phage FCV-11]ASD51762.1 hypothetical protein [Flavobacterium phage V175]ASD51840.1 hypothetical protein [Flavobacterium phage V181]ASD52518.1 hypothetical protein [Flavobacterium phage FCV-10]ASD52591.1 hypothetical protein [Flavobacterium phage FCV-16]ASD52665.1 hypothetical protein [Flavobacterium phage FCV-20]ASD52738.